MVSFTLDFYTHHIATGCSRAPHILYVVQGQVKEVMTTLVLHGHQSFVGDAFKHQIQVIEPLSSSKRAYMCLHIICDDKMSRWCLYLDSSNSKQRLVQNMVPNKYANNRVRLTCPV